MVATKAITGTDPRQTALQNRLGSMLNERNSKYGGELDAIERTQRLLVDRVVPLGQSSPMSFGSNDTELLARFNTGGTVLTERLHAHAATQAGEKLNIPGAYIRDLSFSRNKWERDLAAHLLNECSAHGPRQRVLVRSVAGQIRGVLSDQYRRMDSGIIVRSFLESSINNGMSLYQASSEDTQISVEMLLPQVFHVKLPTHDDEYLSWGAKLTSSDFGAGALKLSIFDYRCRCFNLSVSKSVMKEIHLGSRLPDNIALSEQTYRLDTRTIASAVGDSIKSLISADAIKKRINVISKAADTVIDADNSIKTLPKMGVQKGEVELLKAVLTENNPDQIPSGRLTQYKMSQALSAVAQKVESPVRRRDLEELAGKMIDTLSGV